MPILSVNDAELHYDDVGDGSETIVFIHGLMLASESYAAQRDAFRDRYRVVTFDLRGQGRSAKTTDRLDLDSLAEDTVALVEQLGLNTVHLVGFSMGSFIAMRIAARHPALVRSLTLIGPSADAEEPQNMPRYARLIRFVRWFGPRWIAPQMMRILFGDTYLKSSASDAERAQWLRYLKALPRELHRAAAASASRQAIGDELCRITAPTLVVSGSEDRPIHPERARAVHQGIAGSTFLPFARTGHAVMIERAAEFNERFGAFIQRASVTA
jgi:pimeloyl-ACP methyl ester carboxylesterase